MGKRAENIFYTDGFGGISGTVNKIVACSQEPTTYTQANTTYKLAEVTVDSGDFAEGAGSPDGRKLTVAAQTLQGTGDGTATHIALIDTSGGVLYYVTTCTSVAISNGNPQDFAAWDILIRAPQ